VVLVDNDNDTVKMLGDNIELLSAEQVTAVCDDVINFLNNCDFMFDVIFIDPPYRMDVIAECCEWLESRQCLSDHEKIYIESDVSKEIKGLPDNWQCMKRKTAGQAAYHLFTREMVF